MTVQELYVVDGWDLNFWFNEEADVWRVSAYPYDEAGEWIGEHMMWLNLDVTDAEVAELKLGSLFNQYSADEDFWADARWVIAEYPHLSASFMPKIMSLPSVVKIVDNKLMKVEE